MKNRQKLALTCAFAGVLAGSTIMKAQAQNGAPKYEVDASWPKPLPDRWVLGAAGAVCVDAQDHVLLLNRREVLDSDLDAGTKAPPVIEFDSDGRVVKSWGEKQFDKAVINTFHACHFDADNNVWILGTDSGIVQ